MTTATDPKQALAAYVKSLEELPLRDRVERVAEYCSQMADAAKAGEAWVAVGRKMIEADQTILGIPGFFSEENEESEDGEIASSDDEDEADEGPDAEDTEEPDAEHPRSWSRRMAQTHRALRSQSGRPSVRRAALLAIYYFGPLAPVQIRNVLSRLRYEIADPKQVRNALWTARKAGLLRDVGGRNDFASPSARRRFEIAEVITDTLGGHAVAT